jgi:hypothetical protein
MIGTPVLKEVTIKVTDSIIVPFYQQPSFVLAAVDLKREISILNTQFITLYQT